MLSFEQQKVVDALIYRRSVQGSYEWLERAKRHHRNKIIATIAEFVLTAILLFGANVSS